MEPIRVFCADCGKELYTTEKLTEPLDGPRYCIKCYKTRLQGSSPLSASVEQFIQKVVKDL